MHHTDPNHTDQGYWPSDWPGHDPGYDPDRASIDEECAGIFTERESRARSGYQRVSDDTWARARADYLAGESAPVVCDRYGMRLSTLRNRAAAEGWRRQDQPAPDPVDLDLEREQGLPDPADMAAHALIRLNRAILKGHATEAGRWMRLHIRLLELARRPVARAPAPNPSPLAATIEADLAALEAKLRQLDQLQAEAATGRETAPLPLDGGGVGGGGVPTALNAETKEAPPPQPYAVRPASTPTQPSPDDEILPPRGRGTAVRSTGVVGAEPPSGGSPGSTAVSPLPHPSDGPPPPMGEEWSSDHSDHSDGISPASPDRPLSAFTTPFTGS